MICPACKKVSRIGGVRKLLRGNYNPTTRRRRHPNVQWFRLGDGSRIKLCSDCKRKASSDPKYLVRRGLVKVK